MHLAEKGLNLFSQFLSTPLKHGSACGSRARQIETLHRRGLLVSRLVSNCFSLSLLGFVVVGLVRKLGSVTAARERQESSGACMQNLADESLRYLNLLFLDQKGMDIL